MPKTILDSELVVNFFKEENVVNSLTAKSTAPVNNTPVSKGECVIFCINCVYQLENYLHSCHYNLIC